MLGADSKQRTSIAKSWRRRWESLDCKVSPNKSTRWRSWSRWFRKRWPCACHKTSTSTSWCFVVGSECSLSGEISKATMPSCQVQTIAVKPSLMHISRNRTEDWTFGRNYSVLCERIRTGTTLQFHQSSLEHSFGSLYEDYLFQLNS